MWHTDDDDSTDDYTAKGVSAKFTPRTFSTPSTTEPATYPSILLHFRGFHHSRVVIFSFIQKGYGDDGVTKGKGKGVSAHLSFLRLELLHR
jgi:hypothetical protein